MTDPGILAWLGPAADDLTDEQIERVADAARLIDAYYTDPDEQPERDAALSAVVQHLLGDITPADARQALTDAEVQRARARAAATWVGVMLVEHDGGEQKASAEAVGIDRQALLEALGRKPRRRKPR